MSIEIKPHPLEALPAGLPATLADAVRRRAELMAEERRSREERLDQVRRQTWVMLRQTIRNELKAELGDRLAEELIGNKLTIRPPSWWRADLNDFHFCVHDDRAGVRELIDDDFDHDAPAWCVTTRFMFNGSGWVRVTADPTRACRLPGHPQEGPLWWSATDEHGHTRSCRDLVTALVWATGCGEGMEEPAPAPF